MADQIFNVNCGFFDSVNNDRTYSADQMNLPYKRIVSNGVFATSAGTPSTDLQVISAQSGMKIKVNTGEGLFGWKWFNNPSLITITVPSNGAANSRIDSVIAQVDTRMSGRVGNIIYRQGTAASTPAAPEINTTDGVYEYRLANILVAPSVTSISDADITDMRGSSDCPWVTGLIEQVDTSTLWQQFNAAYAEQFRNYSRDYEEYKDQQRSDWETFMAGLTQQLTVSTNVSVFTSSYTASGSVTNIPIQIASYNPETDVLQVYINGLYADGKYSLNSNRTSIDLTNAINAGDIVLFAVFKSLVSGDIESAAGMMMRLDQKIDDFTADTGWIDFRTAKIRQVGNRVYMTGTVKGFTAGDTIGTLPITFRPAKDIIFTTSAVSGTSLNDTVTICVAADGTVKVKAISGTIDVDDEISLSCTFLSNTGAISVVYRYMGSVATYGDLPNFPKIGDVYMVNAANAVHYIEAGDNVMWNGASWEILQTVITSAEIDNIISSIS